MPTTWAEVLDDLDGRLVSAEHGDLAALDGWAPPAQPAAMTPVEQQRATGIAGRQQALMARLRAERAEVAAAMRATRRPSALRAVTPPPVYLDRVG